MAFASFGDHRLTPARIAAIYLAFGLLGLLVSDVLLVAFVEEPLLGTLQAVKGVVEVLATALLLYVLVSWSYRDFRIQQRATDESPIGITLTDPTREDNPLVFVNDRFEELTGYDAEDALGRNCRFLQGPETDPETRRAFRTAIDEERQVSVDVVNYRKNGAKFWNKVDVAPVRDGDGEVTHFVGFQTDITERKVREERLSVLNRVLRHNVRNKMTVIGGHAEVMAAESDEGPESLSRIRSAAADLRSLTETVRRTESTLQAATTAETSVSLNEQLPVLIDGFRERYPETTFDLSLPDEDAEVRGLGVVEAVEEAVENAVKHNDGPSPRVAVSLTVEDGWLTVYVDDDGPGIPEDEIEVLTEGETPLRHADRLGIWSIHWIVSLAGGSLTVAESDLGGTRLGIAVPTEGS